MDSKFGKTAGASRFGIDSCSNQRVNLDQHSVDKISSDLSRMFLQESTYMNQQKSVRIWQSIRPNNQVLVKSFNKLAFKMLRNGIIFETAIIPWYVHVLLAWPYNESVTEVYEILEKLATNNVADFKNDLDRILKVTKKFVTDNANVIIDPECCIQILKFTRRLICLTTNAHVTVIQDIIFHIAKNAAPLTDKLVQSRLVMEEIEITQCLSEKNISWITDQLGLILGIALGYCSYGLNINPSGTPLSLIPSPLHKHEEKPINSKDGSKTKNRRKQKKQMIDKARAIKSAAVDDILLPELNWTQTSESDYSDSESGRTAFLKKSEKRVRMAALSLTLHIVRIVEKKKLAGYFNEILSGPYSLNQCLKSDNSPHCKITISAILMVLLNDSKLIIAQAQHGRGNTAPYTAWSCLLADLISSLHETICDELSTTEWKPVISSLLRCLAILISVTPYNRLHTGLLSNVYRVITPLLHHNDITISVAALKCVKELIVLEPQTEEQLHIIKHVDSGDDSLIVQYCFHILNDSSCSIVLRSECWTVIGCLAKHHFRSALFGRNIEHALSLLMDDLKNNNNVVVQQCALKALEYIALSVSSYGIECGIDCLQMWLSLLQNGPLVPLLQSISGTLAASACDCVSNISCQVFEELPERLRIFVMTVLFGCVEHEDHLARAAAIRSLGMIIIFPFLSKDIQIIYDVADRVVMALNDSNLTVRIKSAWTLGNLSEVLLEGRNIGIPIHEVPLIKLLEIGVTTGYDHEKVKTCAMRAIGYLLQLIDEQHLLLERVRNLINDTINILVKNATGEGNMKVRWNACYSLGNMFKNVALLSAPVNWQVPAFKALSSLIVVCPNFKVRHSACSALAVLKSRDLYGLHFIYLWVSLLEALNNAQNLPDFSEYKHQRNLIHQLCITICHFVTLITEDDLAALHDLISLRKELLQKHISDVRKQPIDDNSSIFEDASNHIDEYIGSKPINPKHKETALLLKDILSNSKPQEIGS